MIYIVKKSTAIWLAVVFLVLGGVGGYLVVSLRKQRTQELPPASGEVIIKGDLTYKDESGFSFGYPKGIKVSDVTPADEEYYSQLKLSKGDEFLTISVKDAKTSGYENSSLVGAVSLAGMPAKQYAQGGKLITVAIDSGVVYLIEGLKDGDYWEDVQNTVALSFTLAEKTSTSGSGDENTIYEEEEVVE